MTGLAPSIDPILSFKASPMSLRVVIGFIAMLDEKPSVKGHCDITAASRLSLAAVASTWPPPKEVPHITTRFGSILSRLRA
ncbi:Uncharacterised protein [Acinetobacter baumannii]|nr:Uncharacterised protein [Acinetobacter baumannii]SST06660.1 Uncharacterised protein [Acinetobacter baumannii]SST63073.1 Uncharacterised protein [Acinetobacter baumannii]SSU48917.1 Uncharacterised protein [Acinetobacter baumannii]